jgi:predicted ATP-dependent endonuclease of OLD family
MLIKLKNLGPLKSANFKLADLTIICGHNNSGKTYATYALYGFLKSWRQVIHVPIKQNAITQLLEEGNTILDLNDYISGVQEYLRIGCKEYSKMLPDIFASSKERFRDSAFDIELEDGEINTKKRFDQTLSAVKSNLFRLVKEEGSNKLIITLLVTKNIRNIPTGVISMTISDAIKEIIFDPIFPNPFIASAERTGSAIFRKELNFARNRLLDEVSKSDKNSDPRAFLFKSYQDYAMPVKDNVEFTRRLEEISKKDSFIKEKYPHLTSYFDEIIGGNYTVSRNDELFFRPNDTNTKLSMDESSSAVRSLLDIGFYIKHIAHLGDLLIIDEPELNLHPENQRKIARLLATLVNIGIKVFITTHSDYIIKELNLLIMMNQESERLQELVKKENYFNYELISAQKIRVYTSEKSLVKIEGNQRKTNCQTLVEADISQETGIEAATFDKSIDEMNRIQDEIIWG